MAQKAIFVLLLGVLAAASFYKLTESPSVWYDEGLYIQVARNVALEHTYGVQLAPNEFLSGQYMTVGFPLTYPVAGMFTLFGYGIFQARLTMVFFILGFALAGFTLIRKLFDTTTALWALALLAVFPPLYANGKSVLGEVPGLLYIMLAFIALYKARQAPQHLRFAVLTGLSVGLACVTKPVFLLLLPALGAGALYYRRSILAEWRAIGWGVGAASVPVLVWFATQFSQSDSLLTTLRFYANPYAVSTTSLGHTILTNALHLFTDSGPLFLMGMMAAWTVALMLKTRYRESIAPEEGIAYVFAVISILAFLRTGGFYRYLFPYQAIALLFFPAAMMRVTAWLRTFRIFSAPYFSKTPQIVCALLILLSAYQLLFDSWVADFYTSTKTAAWQAHFASLPKEASVFFFNTPEVAVFAPSDQYYQYMTPYRDARILQWGSPELAVLDAGTPDQVVIETRLLESAEPHLVHYIVADTNAKYTILTRDRSR